MRFFALLVAAGALLGLSAQTPPPQTPEKPADAEPVVRWKGTSYAGKDIEAAIGAPATAAVVPWSPWAQSQGYVLDLDEDLRRLFVHSKGRSGSSETSIIGRVLALVDKLAPRPAGSDKPPAILVILELDGPEDFGTLLDDLGRRYRHLATWAAGEKQQIGFVLEEPPAAAFLATAPDIQEWKPKNELANRTAQVALFERFGRMPNWLMQGFAWHAEYTVCGSIYCFPFRAGFVAKKEHRSWGEQLKVLMAKGPPEGQLRPLTIDDLAAWKRGTYENDRALLAWGAASFLAKRHADALPLILEDLRSFRDKDSRIVHADGSWKLKPDYEVPADKQLEILKARAGDDFLAALAKFCAGS